MGSPLARLAAAGAAATILSAGVASPQEPRFREKVDVSRVLLDVRVVDGHGNPLPDLEAADFRVSVDGREVPVESARWVSGTTPYAEGLTPEQAAEAHAPAAPAGRRLVFLFQKDLSNASYITGFLRMRREARRLLDSLPARDEVAILSFDSHLKLWVDFTSDRALLHKAIERSVIFEREPPAGPDPEPGSFAAHFDRAAAREAATLETALLVLGKGLEPLPGGKSVALFGAWMGSFGSSGVQLSSDYAEARRALVAARATVFSLDVTDADSHTLEVGLQQVAEDTGGFYVRTRNFPTLAMDRLERAIAGYYGLSFEKPALPAGNHTVSISLTRRKGTVLTTGHYVD